MVRELEPPPPLKLFYIAQNTLFVNTRHNATRTYYVDVYNNGCGPYAQASAQALLYRTAPSHVRNSGNELTSVLRSLWVVLRLARAIQSSSLQ